jgi:hypothetical protein
MKQLISRFKTSRSIKLESQKWLKIAAGTLLLIGPSGACQVNRGQTPVSGSSPIPAAESSEPLTLSPPSAPPPRPLDLEGPLLEVVRLKDGNPLTIARLVQPTCSDSMASAPAMHLRIDLNSSVGSHVIDLTVKSRSRRPSADPLTNDSVRADVEGYRMSFPVAGSIASDLWSKACAESKSSNPNRIVLGDSEIDQIRDWLEIVSPDCDQLTFGAGGWTCHFPSIDPDVAREELTGIQSTMISRWSRQPYLLARRVAIGLTLAQALREGREPREGAQLDVFCRIISAALPIELPATLASRRWQAAVCGGESKHRRAAALFGLTKTVTEIDFMRQLFERTSRLGHLTLKIPASQVPGSQILIRLAPEADVADNLAYETARLWATDNNESGEIDNTPKSCWHPVYGEHPRLLNLARQLGMTGDATRLACEEVREYRGPSPFPSTERYFADSVTSETEFIVQNGRSKTLRLPAGKYSYTLRVLPDDPEIWDDVSQQSPTASGVITWDAKRPRPIISNWQ